MSLIAGILIDVDHFFDYYLQEEFTLRIRDVFSWCYRRQFTFVFLFFHSLELLFMLWVFTYFFRPGIIWLGFLLGITQHMILDICFNPVRPWGYLFSYRFIKGFRKEHILKPTLA